MEKTGNAYYDFCEMVRHAWTFHRMTEEEQGKCWDALRFAAEQNVLKGVYSARWMILQAIYRAFLAGMGYHSGNWREPDAEPVPF